MGINDDVRIGALPPIAPTEPMPETEPPEGYEWIRNAGTGHWHLFRKMTDEERIYLGRQSPSLDDELDPITRRVIEQEGARPSSLVSVHRPVVRDPLHELQLLRDLEIINQRTAMELGPLPLDGIPAQKKSKPHLQLPAPVCDLALSHDDIGASVETPPEGEKVKLRDMAATAAWAVTAMTTSAPAMVHATGGSTVSSSSENSLATTPPYSLPSYGTKPPVAEGNPPARTSSSPKMAPPPGMVLYGTSPEVLTKKREEKEKIDLTDTALDIGNGGWSKYWYGHRFGFNGKQYFVGFVAVAGECFNQCESQFLIRGKQAIVGAATFVESPDGDDQMMIYNVPWKWISDERFIGRFGSFEKGNIVLDMLPQTYWTPGGHYLLAVPTEHVLGEGINSLESEIFELDPYFLAHGEPKASGGYVWRHVGTVITGGNNVGECDPDIRAKSTAPACWGNTGVLHFVSVPGSDLPVLEVRRKGSELDGLSRIRAVDTHAVTRWRFDEASKRYQEVKP